MEAVGKLKSCARHTSSAYMKMKRNKTLIISLCFPLCMALSSCSGDFWQGMAAGLGSIGSYPTYSTGGGTVATPASTAATGSFGTFQAPTFNFDMSPSAVAVPAYSGGSVSTSSSSSSYSGSSGSSSSGKTCPMCYGIKKCWTCNGKQTYHNPLTGKQVPCPNCTNGLCSKCGGTGRI